MTTGKSGRPVAQPFAKLKSLVFPAFELRQKHWEDGVWTSGRALAQSLAECVSDSCLGKPGEVRSWLLWYAREDYTKNPTARPTDASQAATANPDSPPERKMGVALALVFCAELALRHREDTQQDLGAVLFSLGSGHGSGCEPPAKWFDCQFTGREPVDFAWLEANRPQMVQTMRQLLADEDWVWGWIRSLLDVPVRRGAVHRTFRAAVVGVDLHSQAAMHTLIVEVLDQGTGKVFRHPCDAFDTEPVSDARFAHSMRTAFSAALNEVNKGRPDAERIVADGRWRLLQGWRWSPQDQARLLPLKAPIGASASGAAARLWWHALSGKVSDDRVVVIAQVNDAGQIIAVDNEAIGQKVEAVIKAVIADSQKAWQHFDTIAVVDENVAPARTTVETASLEGRLRQGQLEVIDIASYETRHFTPGKER